VQFPVQPPDVSNWQVSFPDRSMLPQAESTTAWAVPGLKATREPNIVAAATARNDGRGNMGRASS
jgi:hypothetical protein